MADTSLLKNFNATCGGGLVLNKDVYDMQPGEALQLVNFEPSTEGGYRRLNGTTKYNSTIVPQVSASTERVQMSAIFNDKIIAARGGTVVYGDTSGSWTSLATSKGTTHTYDFDKFNFNGTSKIIIATGEAAAFAETVGIPVLAAIPQDEDLRRKSANYQIVGSAQSQWGDLFTELSVNVAEAPPVRPSPVNQDGLLNLFDGSETGADFVLVPATDQDMRGKFSKPKASLEVIYDDAV